MVEELKQRFISERPDDLYNKIVLGNDVWYLREVSKRTDMDPSAVYDDIKNFVSNKLNVHFNNICIVGSAKTGYSLKNTEFNGFRLEAVGSKKASDIDIAIVDNKRFNEFWEILLEMRRMGDHIKDYNSVASGVFRKFVRTDVIPEKYQRAREWNALVDSMIADFQVNFNVYHETSIRLYESWDGLRNYQMTSILKLKNKLNRGGV